MKQITSIKLIKVPDYDRDASYLGTYSNTPEKGAIDRQARGDMGRGELRYWNPTNWDESLSPITRNTYRKQDYERHKALENGEWGFVGIRAVAEVKVSVGNGTGFICQTLKSPGLWGVESDSEEGYFNEIGKEELGELTLILEAFGFSGDEIRKAMEETKSELDF